MPRSEVPGSERAVLAALAILLPMLPGPGSCATSTVSPQDLERRTETVELAGELLDIADIAANAFANEVATLRLAGADDLQAFAAESVRNNAVAYVRSIVLDDDPATALLDLYAFAQLGVWACENRARLYEDIFVEDCAGTYGVVLDRTRRLAEKWMTDEQRDRIDEAVARFKAANPDRTRIGIVRLPDLAKSAGTTTASLRTASPTLFSPVTEAAEQLEQTRLLGNRVLWLLSRLPEALGWRAQTVLMEALASDGFARITTLATDLESSLGSLEQGLDRMEHSVGELATETSTLSRDLGGIGASADRLAESVASVAPLAESLDRTTASLDGMSKELAAFERHAVRVEQAVEGFVASSDRIGDDLESLGVEVDGLGGSVETLGSAVDRLERRIVEIETLEGEIVDGLLWKFFGMSAALIAFTGVVIVIAIRLGRR